MAHQFIPLSLLRLTTIRWLGDMAFWLSSLVCALSLVCLVKVWHAYQTFAKVKSSLRDWKRLLIIHCQLKSIPTVGPSGFLSSWMGAFRFMFHGREIIQEGYSKVAFRSRLSSSGLTSHIHSTAGPPSRYLSSIVGW